MVVFFIVMPLLLVGLGVLFTQLPARAEYRYEEGLRWQRTPEQQERDLRSLRQQRGFNYLMAVMSIGAGVFVLVLALTRAIG